VRFVVDERGDIVNRANYNAFGQPDGNTATGYGFAGEEWDAEAGLLFLRNRYLDPQIGRFLSRDSFPGSLDDPQSFNRYAYAANDPVNLVDPSGLRPEQAKVQDKYAPQSMQGVQK